MYVTELSLTDISSGHQPELAAIESLGRFLERPATVRDLTVANRNRALLAELDAGTPADRIREIDNGFMGMTRPISKRKYLDDPPTRRFSMAFQAEGPRVWTPSELKRLIEQPKRFLPQYQYGESGVYRPAFWAAYFRFVQETRLCFSIVDQIRSGDFDLDGRTCDLTWHPQVRLAMPLSKSAANAIREAAFPDRPLFFAAQNTRDRRKIMDAAGVDYERRPYLSRKAERKVSNG